MLENFFGEKIKTNQKPADEISLDENEADKIINLLLQMKQDGLCLYEIKQTNKKDYYEIFFLDINGFQRKFPFELNHEKLALVVGIFGKPIVKLKLY